MENSLAENKVDEAFSRRYLREDVVVIYRTKEAYGGLSNMASGYPLDINGVHIRTTEALYQSCRFPHLPKVQWEIISEPSPMTAKMRSKPHRNQTRADWEVIRHKIMRWCLRVKLAQNESFGDLLLTTQGKLIVELSKKDDYWGAKPMADGYTLIGQNVLGRLLMELRERLVLEGWDALSTVPPLPIENFVLLNRPILSIGKGQIAASEQTKLL